MQGSARHRPVTSADLFEDLVAPGLGEGTGNACKLPVYELKFPGGGHGFRMNNARDVRRTHGFDL